MSIRRRASRFEARRLHRWHFRLIAAAAVRIAATAIAVALLAGLVIGVLRLIAA